MFWYADFFSQETRVYNHKERNTKEILEDYMKKAKQQNKVTEDDPELEHAFSYFFLLKILSDYDTKGKVLVQFLKFASY